MRRERSRSSGWWPALFYAVALHAVVIAMLVVGFRFVSHTQPVHGPVMQAVVMREPAPEVAEREKTKQEEERKKRDTELQRVQEDQRRKDAERVRLEIERKQQEEEKKKQDEEKKKQDEAQQKKQEAERKKQAADAEKKKHDAERKKEDKQRQTQAEQALREQLAEEEKGRTAVRSARLQSEIDKYKAAIAQRVSRQWVRPPTSRKDLQCTVHVRQAPGGEVLEAKVVRSSGDTTFDRSVESAVYKASPLPAPENVEVFDRDIEFIFRPEN